MPLNWPGVITGREGFFVLLAGCGDENRDWLFGTGEFAMPLFT
jgi:hypothetical protein